MRLASLLIPFNSLTGLLASISVRTRIIALALIPVIGFLANGLTYISGEGDVGTAFETVKYSAALSGASRDFKSSIAALRIIVKDFTANPSENLVVSFQEAHARAVQSLNAIAASIDRPHAENIDSLRKDVMALRDTFTELVREQKILGFDENTGLRNNLRQAGNAVERIINENMTWVAEADASKLMMTLLLMREFEAEYRLTQSDLTKQQFFVTYKKFTDTFALIDGTPEMKNSLEREVKTYADTFAKWVDGYDRVQPLRAVIDIDSQNMLPRADDIIERASERADDASSALTASQANTRTGIIAVGIGMVAFGLGFSWLIGRSITRPLNGLSGVMKRLAAGDTGARIPATGARDEIGEMARAVIVFRDTMIEREKLAAIQADASQAQSQRNNNIGLTIAQFKHSVESALTKLRGASMKLEMSSTDLNKSANVMSKLRSVGYIRAVARMISPTRSIGNRACGVCSRSRLRKYVILTQRWPFSLRSLRNSGALTEQNQVDTTNVVCSTSGTASGGQSLICVVGAMNSIGNTPRALAMPEMASTTRRSSNGSVRNNTRSVGRMV